MKNKFIEAFERGEEIRTRDGKSKVLNIRIRNLGDQSNVIQAVIVIDGDKLATYEWFENGLFMHLEESDLDLVLPKRKGWIAYYKEATSLVHATKEFSKLSLINRLNEHNFGYVEPSEFKYIEVEQDD